MSEWLDFALLFLIACAVLFAAFELGKFVEETKLIKILSRIVRRKESLEAEQIMNEFLKDCLSDDNHPTNQRTKR